MWSKIDVECCFIILNVLFSWFHSFLWFWCPEFQLLLSLNVLNCDIDDVQLIRLHTFFVFVNIFLPFWCALLYRWVFLNEKWAILSAMPCDRLKYHPLPYDRLNYHPLPCGRLNWHTLLNQWEDRKFTWNIIIIMILICIDLDKWCKL
jgi:hypothetical protein